MIDAVDEDWKVRGYIGSAVVLLAIVALALWQWKALVRFVVAATAASIAHVALSFDPITLTLDRAVFENVRVTSAQGEPIARIDRITLTYDLRDLLPGGTRLFGLKSVDANSLHLTIVRHADGSYNVPSLARPVTNGGKQLPLIVRAGVHDGSIDITMRVRTRLRTRGISTSKTSKRTPQFRRQPALPIPWR